MKKILIFLIAFAIHLTLFSHPWKPSHFVIIDSDGGIDDMKAITMMLASPDIRVLAITASPGALKAENAYMKIRSLLNTFHHEGIPVGINTDCKFKSPDFGVASAMKWGNENGISPVNAADCINLIKEVLEHEKNPVSFICLGGLSTAAEVAEEVQGFETRVTEIIWSSGNSAEGFNYRIDPGSVKSITKLNIPLRKVGYTEPEILFDGGLIDSISGIQTRYAGKVKEFFDSETARNHKYSYSGSDEMAALYLQYPSCFVFQDEIHSPGNISDLRACTMKLLAGETVARNQVIRNIPSDPGFYFEDIKPYVTEIISKYGMDEWTSGVIANELHRHLGVFAIIGVKMGIRAREYFNTGVDEFQTISYAGSTPPLSCMNDGIQVSTGSTPGHGLLKVAEKTEGPSAEFTYRNKKIRLTLKPEIAGKVTEELKEINFIYGLDSNIYWEMVRKNSIKYWLNLDRNEIFDLVEIQ